MSEHEHDWTCPILGNCGGPAPAPVGILIGLIEALKKWDYDSNVSPGTLAVEAEALLYRASLEALEWLDEGLADEVGGGKQ